jgi:hypothetical protein
MVIVNKKKWDDVCKYLRPFCKIAYGANKNEVNNLFLIEKDLMCATNKKVMAYTDVGNCVINDDKFAFPCEYRPIKVATLKGDSLVIESNDIKFTNDDKKYLDGFDWKRIIPTNRPSAIREYDFSEYNVKSIKYGKYAKVIFCKNGEVVFEYKDECDTIGTFGEVMIDEEDMFGDNPSYGDLETVSFPMTYIMDILRINKRFKLYQYGIDETSARRIKTNGYNFLIMPLIV